MPAPIPDGYHTLTPHLNVRNAAKAVEFYEKAFGAEEIARQSVPGSEAILHCQLRIGDSFLMLCDENPEWGALSPTSLKGSPITVHIFVEDVDAFFDRATAAGAEVTMPLSDTFWGDRYGRIKDPFDHQWSIASRVEDLSPEEIEERAKKAFAGPG